MRKTIALILSLLLLSSACTFVQAEETENHIKNGSFENGSAGVVTNWVPFGYAAAEPSGANMEETLLENGDFETFDAENRATGWEYYNAGKITVSRDIKHDGEGALRLSGGSTSYVLQTVPVSPLQEYFFSGYGRAAENDGTGMYVQLKFYNSDGFECGRGTFDTALPSDGTWREMTVRKKAPATAAKATVTAYMTNAEGLCYFDDFVFQTATEEFCLETNESFYYSDLENGTAVVTAAAAKQNQMVEFAISYAGKTVDGTKKSLAFSQNKATYVFPLALLSELKKEYVLTAKVLEDGEEITRLEAAIYKYPRPSRLTKEGIYMVEGEPFYPVYGYRVYEEDYAKAREMGINVIGLAVSPETAQTEMDRAATAGFRVIVTMSHCPGKLLYPPGHPANVEYARKLVMAVKDHPAMFGYYSVDEVFLRRDTEQVEEWMHASYKLIRDLDDVNPIFSCEPFDYELGARYADILSVDPYPYSTNAAKVTSRTEAIVEAMPSGKPAYTVVQSYAGTDRNWFPSSMNLRDQVFRAMTAGAKGIAFYTFSDAVHDSKTPIYKKIDNWEDTCRMGTEEMPILFDCYGGKHIPFSTSGNEDALDSMLYQSWVTEDGGMLYLLVHNRSTAVAEITVPLQSADGEVSVGAFSAEKIGGTVETGTGVLTVSLAAGEAAVYKITPALNIETARLKTVESLASAKEEPKAVQHVSAVQNTERYICLPQKDAGIFQNIDGLSPMTSYLLSLRYKSNMKDAVRLEVQFCRRDENGFLPLSEYCEKFSLPYIEAETVYTERFGIADGMTAWQDISFDFYVPAYANAMKFTLCTEKTGSYVLIDDVYLSKRDALNLVRNGGFDFMKDENTLSGGWFAYDEYMQYYGNVAFADGAIELSEATEASNVRQEVYLYGDTLYALSFQYKNSRDEAPTIRIFHNADGNTLQTFSVKNAKNWKQYTLYFTVKNTGKHTLWFGGPSAKGVSLFDDIALWPIEKGLRLGMEAVSEISPAGGTGATEYLYWLPIIDAEKDAQKNLTALTVGIRRDMLVAAYKNDAVRELLSVSSVQEDVTHVKAFILPIRPYQTNGDISVSVYTWENNDFCTLRRESTERLP